eukprot:gene1650-1834_t
MDNEKLMFAAAVKATAISGAVVAINNQKETLSAAVSSYMHLRNNVLLENNRRKRKLKRRPIFGHNQSLKSRGWISPYMMKEFQKKNSKSVCELAKKHFGLWQEFVKQTLSDSKPASDAAWHQKKFLL